MAANPSTYQYEPLRTPSNWTTEEKRLIGQLTDTLDDIYRRWGRLRFADLGNELLISKGVVDISAAASYNLRSGTGTSGIGMSNNETDSYFLWAGNVTPASAPFSVKMDGTIRNVSNCYVQTITDNADSTHGIVLDVYFPSIVSLVDKCLLSIKFSAFRAYETGAASGGGSTSGSGGSQTKTSSGGSGSDDVSGISGDISVGSAGSDHKHASGSYTALISTHSHSVTIDDHTHSTPAHTHGITYGIYESTTPTTCTLKVDGVTKLTGVAAFTSTDIASYFSTTDSKITRDVFHTVEIIPNTLGRISAHLYIKTTQVSKVAGVL